MRLNEHHGDQHSQVEQTRSQSQALFNGQAMQSFMAAIPSAGGAQ